LEAKGVLDLYYKQLQEIETIRREALKERQRDREKKCDEHYYTSNGKYTSTRSCQFCGKTIE